MHEARLRTGQSIPDSERAELVEMSTKALSIAKESRNAFIIAMTQNNHALTVFLTRAYGSFTDVCDMLRNSLGVCLQIGHRQGVMQLFGLIGIVSASQASAADSDEMRSRYFERTAHLFGAQKAEADRMEVRLPRIDQDLSRSTAAKTAEVLGSQRYAESESAGRALGFRQAVAFALETVP